MSYYSGGGGGGSGFPNPGQGYGQPGYGYSQAPPPQQGYGYPQQPPPPPQQQHHHHHQQQQQYPQQQQQQYGAPGGPPPQYAGQPMYQQPMGVQQHDGGQYQYSSMTGKKKALLIGINYVGTRSELRGCWNDINNMKHFIMSRGYKEDDMVILTDASRDARSVPTRQNMTAAMHWLVRGASPGDALFFHYSGHGGQAPATEGDEDDGMNETILPVDYDRSGQMEDDELHAIMVRPLPMGCRLTAIFDSCHSGTALDLPYVYSTSGNIKETNIYAGVGKGLMGAAMDYARGNVGGMVSDLFKTFKTAQTGSGAAEYTKQHRSSPADVVMFSGCKDSQTSADAVEAGKATGAMSYAFIKVLTDYPQLSYLQLLNACRDVLASKYSQKPQMSSSHPTDLNVMFSI